jgi:hypothetical protein
MRRCRLCMSLPSASARMSTSYKRAGELAPKTRLRSGARRVRQDRDRAAGLYSQQVPRKSSPHVPQRFKQACPAWRRSRRRAGHMAWLPFQACMRKRATGRSCRRPDRTVSPSAQPRMSAARRIARQPPTARADRRAFRASDLLSPVVRL